LVRYIHQKINQTVFQNPVAVMDNVMRVTTHIWNKLVGQQARDITRKVLTVVPTSDGRPFYRDGDNECWRTFVFVEKVQSFESVQSVSQASEAGKAFGTFQSLLSDLEGKRLHETIPNFHNTRMRFAALQHAIEEDHSNPGGRERPLQGGNANADVRSAGARLSHRRRKLSDRGREIAPRAGRKTDCLHHRHPLPDRLPGGRHLFPGPSLRP